MKTEEIVRNWKDENYRADLSLEKQSLLPGNPAGLLELSDAELTGADGGSLITICGDISLITICMSDFSFCIPTWGLCPI
jgi:mersacidin/lichenicidin family type 2 lantibiotic